MCLSGILATYEVPWQLLGNSYSRLKHILKCVKLQWRHMFARTKAITQQQSYTMSEREKEKEREREERNEGLVTRCMILQYHLTPVAMAPHMYNDVARLPHRHTQTDGCNYYTVCA